MAFTITHVKFTCARVVDILIACIDNLKGFDEVIRTIYPNASCLDPKTQRHFWQSYQWRLRQLKKT